ncbi:MAG: glycosyltransferase [Pseudomonadota bacterium]
MSLRVLMTNLTLAGRTGTEIVTRDLALALKRAGHAPTVYTPRPGPIAGELRAAGVPVVSDIAEITEKPDVIHGHHVIQTGVAAARFPDTPAVFVCHDAVAWHDTPPRLPNIRAFVGVSERFAQRLIEDGAPADAVSVIPNGVDTDRFQPGGPLPKKPRKALAFAKNQAHLPAVIAACQARKIKLDIVGAAVGRIEAAPEALLPGYDLVFASALSALEALACLRSVVVCDGRGLAGMATPEAYAAMRRENFGLALLDKPLTAETVGAEIDRYDPLGAAATGVKVRREAGLDVWAAAWVDLYSRLIAEHAPAPDAETWGAALSAHLQTWDPGRVPTAWATEREALNAAMARLDSGLQPLTPGVVAQPGDPTLSLTGFHPAEAWGAWSAREAAAVRLILPGGVHPTRLRLRLSAFLPESRPILPLTLLLNGQPLGEAALDGDGGARDLLFALDPTAAERTLWISLRSPAPLAPTAVGASGDPRPLGYGLHEVEIA